MNHILGTQLHPSKSSLRHPPLGPSSLTSFSLPSLLIKSYMIALLLSIHMLHCSIPVKLILILKTKLLLCLSPLDTGNLILSPNCKLTNMSLIYIISFIIIYVVLYLIYLYFYFKPLINSFFSIYNLRFLIFYLFSKAPPFPLSVSNFHLIYPF